MLSLISALPRAAVLALILACADGGTRDCIPAETRRCWCAGAVESAQACSAVGTWEPCRCALPFDVPDVPDARPPDWSDASAAGDSFSQSADDAFRAPLDASPSPLDVSPAPDAPPSGAALYASLCAGCHGPTGLGTSAGPGLGHALAEDSDAELARTIRRGGDGMPPFYGLTDAELDALISWLRATVAPSDDD